MTFLLWSSAGPSTTSSGTAMEPMAGQDAVPDGNLGKYVVSVTKFKQMNYLLVKISS